MQSANPAVTSAKLPLTAAGDRVKWLRNEKAEFAEPTGRTKRLGNRIDIYSST